MRDRKRERERERKREREIERGGWGERGNKLSFSDTDFK